MLELQIEGNYIDSFIYSGSFFLLDSHMKLSSFAWTDILELVFNDDDKLQRTFLEGSLTKLDAKYYLSSKFMIHKKDLDKFVIDSYQFENWITDIDIYKNTLFASSHEGILTVASNREESVKRRPQFKFLKSSNKLTDESVFDMSVGNLSRLIISCGSNGALELFMKPKSDGTYELTNEWVISDKNWIGCEWDTKTGFAILKNRLEKELLKFKNPPSFIESDNKKISFNSLDKEVKNKIHEETRAVKPEKIDSDNFLGIWIIDENIIGMDKKLNLHKINLENSSIEGSNLNINVRILENILDSILDTQKTQYGLVVETLEKLIVITDNSREIEFKDITNWRTFPKSKNYQNHLHVVQDDYISVLGFEI